MDATNHLIDSLYRERVKRARQMSPETKLLAGAVLFETARGIMIDGIRNQFPAISDDEIRRILRERLAIARRLESVR